MNHPTIKTIFASAFAFALTALTTQAQLKSAPDGAPVSITFQNSLTSPVNLNWLDFQGNEVFYIAIPPGGTHIQPSSEGHVWRARVNTQTTSEVVGVYVATGLANQTFTFAKASPVPPPPPGGSLVLSEQSLGSLRTSKGSTFLVEDLLKRFPDHRTSVFVTKGLIFATITTVETYDHKELFSLYTYHDRDGEQWNPVRRIDAIEVSDRSIMDHSGVRVGMTYNDVVSIHGKNPSITRGEGDVAHLTIGNFHYRLSYPQRRAPGASNGQTEQEIFSGAAKIDAIIWPELIY